LCEPRAPFTSDGRRPFLVRFFAGLFGAIVALVPLGSGAWVFGLSVVLSAIGAAGFFVLSRWMHAGERARAEPVETAPPSRAGV